VATDRADALEALFLRYHSLDNSGKNNLKIVQGEGLFSALEAQHAGGIALNAGDRNTGAVIDETLKFAARLCFERLYELVYAPFRATPEFEPMRLLICDPDSWITTESFVFLDVIAEGGFGLVLRCRKRSSGVEYAMKIQPKARLLRHFRKDKRRVMTEMQAYSLCDHPYVTKLAYATQTSSLAMLVLPVAACGDLSRSLGFTSDGRFPVERVQFYAAEIVSALVYLHNLNIVYRDLKPGNILLNADGHVMLADFGSLKDMGGKLCNSSERLMFPVPVDHSDYISSAVGSEAVTPDPSMTVTKTRRTLSLVGTMEYMAPEILVMFGKRVAHKDGYTTAVDWWSLGILIYKLLVGCEPFRRVSSESVQTTLPDLLSSPSCCFEEVFIQMFGTVQYQQPELPPVAVDLLQRLFAFDPDRRLGCVGGSDIDSARACPVRSHAFFGGIDWCAIENKCLPPPYYPRNEIPVVPEPAVPGVDFAAALMLAGRLDLMDEDDAFRLFSPPAGMVESILNSLGSKKRERQLDSAMKSMSDTFSKLKVADWDQKYFYGWNYVSCDLFEAPKKTPWLISTSQKLLRSLRSLTQKDKRKVAPVENVEIV